MDPRRLQLDAWLTTLPDISVTAIAPLAGDASFRRYFRVQDVNDHWVAMDAPPEREDCRPFVALADHWHARGIPVPRVHARDLEQGFLLLDDLGDDLLNDRLTPETVDDLYQQAMDQLASIQALSDPEDYPLPPYDEALLDREMHLFPEWLLERKLGLTLDAQEQALLESTFQRLKESALTQPTVTVHRDYHSRNLLVTGPGGLGIIDFQDAVRGPVTYDLVSLLKDCYRRWPADRVETWLARFHHQSREQGHHNADLDTFRQWFELMGMQRHLKAAGIFARLSERDGKHGYLGDIPRTLDYLIEAANRQGALQAFGNWLEQRVKPVLAEATGA